uniref:Uncharacterized protein n=1 Tax=Tanacetum cinerariifolium TaxID=118510 RepID=A0A699HT22_TANCI|nr:hypothetical protein [Tanacetum cinerariifolium]
MRRIYNDEGRQKTYFRSRGNTNMTFDLRPTEDVLPWLGNANIAFDLRPTEDVLPWPGNANMAFDLRPTGNGYVKSRQNRSKTDKTRHGNDKSSRNQRRRRIHLKSNPVNPLS